MLNYFKVATILILMLLFLVCSNPFPTSFEQVNETYCRAIAMEVTNHHNTNFGDVAPGDTVIIDGYFAGEYVSSFSWEISFTGDNYFISNPLSADLIDPVKSEYFVDTTSVLRIYDDKLLHDRVTLKIRIPSYYLYDALNINRTWWDSCSYFETDGINKYIKEVDKVEIIDFIESSKHVINAVNCNIPQDSILVLIKSIRKSLPHIDCFLEYFEAKENLTVYSSFFKFVNIVLPLIETNMAVVLKINGCYKVITRLMVRYHTKYYCNELSELTDHCLKLPKGSIEIIQVQGQFEFLTSDVNNLIVSKTLLDSVNSFKDTVVLNSEHSYFVNLITTIP